MEDNLLDVKSLFENIDFLDNDTIQNLDFYECALYLEILNKLEENYKELIGEENE